jgi:hypothetical protein
VGEKIDTSTAALPELRHSQNKQKETKKEEKEGMEL